MLQRIILVRHGDYGDSGSLTREGKRQVRDLAEVLRPLIIDRIAILTSPMPRTRQTAAILARALSPSPVEVTVWNLLAGGESDDADAPFYCLENLHDRVGDVGRKSATIILVTHEQVCHDYLNYYMRQQFPIDRTNLALGYAEAVVIDCESGNRSVLRHINGSVVVQNYHL